MRLVEIETSDKVVIAGNLYVPDAKSAAPGLLLLHMTGSNRLSWSAFAEYARSKGTAVLAIDLRGHALSIRTAEGAILNRLDFTPEDWASSIRDVSAAFEYLRAQPFVDKDRLSLAGASFGANLALRFAAANPAVRSLVLISPALDCHGVTTLDAMKAYGERPVYFIVSEEDQDSSESTDTLLEASASERKRLNRVRGFLHGTAILRQSESFNKDILDWILKNG